MNMSFLLFVLPLEVFGFLEYLCSYKRNTIFVDIISQ